MIRYTKKWGYIVVDRKARATIHGHSEKSMKLDLFAVLQIESTRNWDIAETNNGDIIFSST